MSLTGKQKKYLKKHLKKEPLAKIASQLKVDLKEIEDYLIKIWGKEKYLKFTEKKQSNLSNSQQDKIASFNLKNWFKKNLKAIIFLSVIVFVVYLNSLGNEFVSDDIQGILENRQLDNFSHIFANPPVFIQSFTSFIINKLFGRFPSVFRLVNVLFHLGTVLTTYLLLYLLIDPLTAFLTSVLFAVHPLQIEAVAWISGGPYSKYAFFLVLSLLFFNLAKKNKKNYWYSLIFFVLALLTSEKAMFFPIVLLFFIISFSTIKKSWKKLIVPFIIGGFWILIYVSRIGQRVTDLQVDHYSEMSTLNPFLQIPVAIISYLKLIFWPSDLTLYHTELKYTEFEFVIIQALFIVFLGIIIFSFKRYRNIFFWLLFFIISLSPTLTPFGISWIVAERYVYLGTIGVFTSVVLIFKKFFENEKLKPLAIIAFSLIVIALSARTIRRNIDWKNQDNLWLAAAINSPSSPQNHNNLGDYYARYGKYDQAVEEFKKAIELKKGYADAYHNLANTYFKMGNIDLTIENYLKAVEFNPKLWQSYQNLSAIYFDRGNYSLAESSLNKAIAINPENTNIHLNLAIVYLQQKKFDQAKKEINISLQLDPNNQRAKSLLLQLPSN